RPRRSSRCAWEVGWASPTSCRIGKMGRPIPAGARNPAVFKEHPLLRRHRKEAVVGSSTTPGFRRSTAAGGLLFLHLPSRGGTVESLRLSVSGAECGPRLSFATRSGSSVVSYELTAGRGQVAGVEGPPR